MKRAFEKRINRRRPYLVFIISISFGSFSTAVASCRLALDIRDTACCCCPAQHPPQRNPNCCCRQGPCSKLTPHVPRWKDSTHQLAHCFLLVRFVSLARKGMVFPLLAIIKRKCITRTQRCFSSAHLAHAQHRINQPTMKRESAGVVLLVCLCVLITIAYTHTATQPHKYAFYVISGPLFLPTTTTVPMFQRHPSSFQIKPKQQTKSHSPFFFLVLICACVCACVLLAATPFFFVD